MSTLPHAKARLAAAAIAGLWLATATASPAPAAAPPVSPSRLIPKDDLIAFSEFTGLAAHKAAWEATNASRLLRETPTGAMLKSVMEQLAEAALEAAIPEGKRPSGKEVVAGIFQMAGSGFAVGIAGKPGAGPPRGVVVLSKAGEGQVGGWVRQLLGAAAGAMPKHEVVTREDGRKVTFATPAGEPAMPIAWWFEGVDLVIVAPGTEANVELVVETATGKRPSAIDDPARAELARTADGFEPAFVAYASFDSLPPLPPTLGLSGLKRLDSRWGFQGPALVSVTRLVAPAPRTGLLALMDGPTFARTEVLPIPPGLNDYTIASADPGKLFDQLVAIARGLDPKADAAVKQLLDAAKEATGVGLRDEILAQIGPKMAFYIEPTPTYIWATPYQSFVDWGVHPPKATAVIQVRDPAKFARTLETLADVANRQLKAKLTTVPEGGEIKLKPLAKPEIGYTLEVPLGTFPLPSGVRPTILLGRKSLAIAISPAAARKALAYEVASPVAPTGVIAALPDNLVALNVSDPSVYMADLIANVPFLVQATASLAANSGPMPGGPIRLDLDPDKLPSADQIKPYLFPSTMSVSVDATGLKVVTRESIPSANPLAVGPVGVALLLPAVQAARTAAKRSQSVNNLKQIMLALHNFESVNGNFPAATIADAEGKPLLSWRVAILPYIEQQELYNEFHLDEPWDSPHNMPLAARMPIVYKSPANPPDDGETYYQAIVGGGALFDPATKGPKLTEITDGTSNTIAIVEAKEGVPWTKPEDLTFDPEGDLPEFGGPMFPGGFNVGFADGSVKFLKNSVAVQVLKALITRAGGEVISADSF